MNLSTRDMAAALLVVTLVTLILIKACAPNHDVQLAVAHEQSAAAEQHAAAVAPAYVAAKKSAATTRADAARARDTIRIRITDTILVKEALRKDSVAIAQDSIALVAADTVIEAERSVTRSLRKELAVAAQRPRLAFTGDALYEPLGGALSGAVAMTIRVTGSLSAIARCNYRVDVGEHPRCGIGASITL